MRRYMALAYLVLILGGASSEAADHCATQPPPQGLVERCRRFTFFLPSPPRSEHQIRVSLDARLLEWMSTCAIADRAPRLVSDAEASIDRVFALIKDMPSHHSAVAIIPEYTPLTFTQGGKTCYGVKSVSFRVPGAAGAVDIGEPTFTAGPTSDMVKEAAKAGLKALKDSGKPFTPDLSRLHKVLTQLEKYGKDLDDTWYNVQPYNTGDPMNAAACYKEFRAGRGNVCRPADEALKACERHLAEDLVQSYHYDKVAPARYAEILEIKANDIQRSMDHLVKIQNQGSPGALPCPSIATVFMPKIAELARRHSLYSAGGY
jgi:hypothetical protein